MDPTAFCRPSLHMKSFYGAGKADVGMGQGAGMAGGQKWMQKQQRLLLAHVLFPNQLTGFFLSVLSSPQMGGELTEPRVMGRPWGGCQTVMWPWPRHRRKGKKRGGPEPVGRAQPWDLTLVLWVCFASCCWNPKKEPSYATGHLHFSPFTSAWPKAHAPEPQISAGWISAGLSPTLLCQENTFFLGEGILVWASLTLPCLLPLSFFLEENPFQNFTEFTQKDPTNKFLTQKIKDIYVQHTKEKSFTSESWCLYSLAKQRIMAERQGQTQTFLVF